MRGATSFRTAEMCHPVTASTAPWASNPSTSSATVRRRPGAVDDDEPQLAGEDPALRVHLFGSQLSAQLTGRAENPCRALQGHDQRDIEGRPATGRPAGPNGSSGHSAKLLLR